MQGWTPDFIPKLTADAVDMKVIDRIIHDPGRRRRSSWSSELARKEGIFVGITCRRDACRRAEGRCRRAEGREHPLHAARHRRALSEHAAVRRRPGRHDRGGAGDLTLDARPAVPGQGVVARKLWSILTPALGQKRTCAAQKVMSALPPKADMCSATRDVR